MRPLSRLVPAAALALLPVLGQAQDRDDARPREVQRLQEDLANLDGDLSALPAGDARTDDLRQRAEDLKEEVIFLKVKMRRHQAQGGSGTGVSYEEVSELRRAVADLREDIAETALGEAREVRIPAGTEMTVRLEEPLSSRTARLEDRFEATVARPLRVSGVVAVPAGSRVRGVVRHAERAERPSRGGRLELEFDALYVGRQRLDLRARVSALQEREDAAKAEKAGIGAVLGGVVGTILGGKKGAVVGVIVGGAGAVVGSKGDDLDLHEGTVLVVKLDRELVVPRR